MKNSKKLIRKRSNLSSLYRSLRKLINLCFCMSTYSLYVCVFQFHLESYLHNHHLEKCNFFHFPYLPYAWENVSSAAAKCRNCFRKITSFSLCLHFQLFVYTQLPLYKKKPYYVCRTTFVVVPIVESLRNLSEVCLPSC